MRAFDRLAEGHNHVQLAPQVNMAFGQSMRCGPDFLGFHPRRYTHLWDPSGLVPLVNEIG